MLHVYITLLLPLLVHWKPGSLAALPKWVHKVESCPDAGNISQWLEASKKLNCYHNLTSNKPNEQEKVYHCLPSSFLNETVEFCGRNVPVEPGKCPVYNYEVAQNVFPNSYNCSKFSAGCPEKQYFSKEVYNYTECLGLNRQWKCFKAEFNCSNMFQHLSPKIETERNSTSVYYLWILLAVPVVIVGFIFGCLSYRRKNIKVSKNASNGTATCMKREESCHLIQGAHSAIPGDNHPELHKVFTETQCSHVPADNAYADKCLEDSILCQNNKLLNELNKAMTDEDIKSIKALLEDRKTPALNTVSDSKTLLTYLAEKYLIFQNMIFVQGLFEACKCRKLFDICIAYAKSKQKDPVCYFESDMSRSGFTKVKFTMYYPEQSSYTEEELETFKNVIHNLTGAEYNDILLCAVKKGSVIVVLLIRDSLIPKVRTLFTPVTDRSILRLKHRIIKVMIEDQVIYTSEDTSNPEKENTTSNRTALKEPRAVEEKNAKDMNKAIRKEDIEGTDTVNAEESSVEDAESSDFKKDCILETHLANVRITCNDKDDIDSELNQLTEIRERIKSLTRKMETVHSPTFRRGDDIIGELFIPYEKLFEVVPWSIDELHSLECTGANEAWIAGSSEVISRVDIHGSVKEIIKTSNSFRPRDISLTRYGELLYISSNNTVQIVKEGKSETLIHPQQGWYPHRVCSTRSGDILVQICEITTKKIIRYQQQKEIQVIAEDERGNPIFEKGDSSLCLTENTNEDICISDPSAKMVIIVSREGRVRFRYYGSEIRIPLKNKPFNPTGIVADALSQIIVADSDNSCLHILDKNGKFLKYISNCFLYSPRLLSVDGVGRLWVGLDLTKPTIIKVLDYSF